MTDKTQSHPFLPNYCEVRWLQRLSFKGVSPKKGLHLGLQLQSIGKSAAAKHLFFRFQLNVEVIAPSVTVLSMIPLRIYTYPKATNPSLSFLIRVSLESLSSPILPFWNLYLCFPTSKLQERVD